MHTITTHTTHHTHSDHSNDDHTHTHTYIHRRCAQSGIHELSNTIQCTINNNLRFILTRVAYGVYTTPTPMYTHEITNNCTSDHSYRI